jgi:hypothetical protein
MEQPAISQKVKVVRAFKEVLSAAVSIEPSSNPHTAMAAREPSVPPMPTIL